MKKPIALLLVALAGCATTEDVWVKRGASDHDFHQDSGQCRAQAFSIPGGGMQMNAVVVYQSCLQGKGWYLERQAIQR